MTPSLSWPVAAIVIAVVAAVTVLGVVHLITPDWIERTFTGLLGVLLGGGVGYAIGLFRARPAGSLNGAPAASRVSHHDLGGSE